MKVIIRNHDDLIEFLERKEVTTLFAHELVEKVLKVLIIFYFDTKEELIEHTKKHLEKFYADGNTNEKPLFLLQKGETFDVKDLCKPLQK